MYYTLIDNLAFLVNSLPPYNGSVTFTGSLFSFTPVAKGVQPAPGSIFAPQGVEAAAKTPAVNEWNLTVEQQVSSKMAVRIGYVGSFGYHGLLSVDPNSIPAQICSNPSGCTTGGTGAARGAVAQNAQYIPVGTRPNPQLSGGFFWYTEGNNSYNALQLELNRRLSANLQFRVNYTWAKSLDLNSGLTGAQAQNQAQMILDRNDLRRDWGPSALTPTSQGSISAHYELPFGDRNSSGFGNKLVSGWQVNGITSLLSGFPITRNPDRPSLNPSFSGPVLLRKQTQWFDPNAFVLPTVGTYGNLGRGTLRGPGLSEVDLSVLKNTSISERVSVQFRVEFFNALNHTNLGVPNPIVFTGTTFSPSAGLITTTATTSRQIQLGLKLIY